MSNIHSNINTNNINFIIYKINNNDNKYTNIESINNKLQ